MVRGSNPIRLAQAPSGGMKFTYQVGAILTADRYTLEQRACAKSRQRAWAVCSVMLPIMKDPDGSADKSPYCSCRGTQVQFPAITLGR